jgi:hypothetical protein
MKANYPAATDLEGFLTAAGLASSLVDSLDTATAVAAGIIAFEKQAGRKFYAAGNTTRTFDPPINLKGFLDLKADLASGVTPVVEVNGETKTAVIDYRFLPQDAAAESLPYTMLQLKARWLWPSDWDDNGVIEITGRWSYRSDGVPEDAWRAMLAAAGLDLLPQIGAARFKGLVSWSEAGTSENYGANPFGGLAQYWETLVQKTAAHYRRVTVGL